MSEGFEILSDYDRAAIFEEACGVNGSCGEVQEVAKSLIRQDDDARALASVAFDSGIIITGTLS